MKLLPDWMYRTIEESFTCQFVSIPANGVPVALPLFLSSFDPDTGMLIFSSSIGVKRLENVRRHPQVALLFSPAGVGQGEPRDVLLVQGQGMVDDSEPEQGWKRYFAGWARRQPAAREMLAQAAQISGPVQRAVIRVQPIRFLGWQEGKMEQVPEIVEVGQ